MGQIYFPHVVKAKRAPVSTDDKTKGYVAGQIWIHENEDIRDFYICTNETANSAEWSNAIDKLADSKNPVWSMSDFISSVKKNMGLGTAAFVDTGEVKNTIPVIGDNNKIADKLINTHTIVSDKTSSNSIVTGSSIGTSTKRYATIYSNLTDALRISVKDLTVSNDANINGNTTIDGSLTVSGDIVGTNATFDSIIVADGNNINIDTSVSSPIDLNYITTYQILPNNNIGTNHTIGNSSSRFASIYGKNIYASGSVKSVYFTSDNGDIAERFYSKTKFLPGNIISINENDESEDEIRLSNFKDKIILGVVSENPAYELNSTLDKDFSFPIAYVGRVNILIGGPIKKGQRVKMSLIDGVGIAVDDNDNDDDEKEYCFAQALESSMDYGAKLVKCVLIK